MVKKMARGKDLEVDQLQSRVNSSEGEFVQGTLCRELCAITLCGLCVYMYV